MTEGEFFASFGEEDEEEQEVLETEEKRDEEHDIEYVNQEPKEGEGYDMRREGETIWLFTFLTELASRTF